MGIMKSLENLLNAQAEKNRAVQHQILMQQKQQEAFMRYRSEYAILANEIAIILDKIQQKKVYFLPFDISTITSAFNDYQTNSTMPFYIPWAYKPRKEEYGKIINIIRDELRPVLGSLYPQYRHTDMFDIAFGLKGTSYGIDLVSRQMPFY